MGLSCPVNYIAVPANSAVGQTAAFCVAKYEIKNLGSVATSQAASTPWVNITQTAAIAACSALGAKYHLITNPEWMTIAKNIETIAGNWSGSVLSSGHNDGTPNSSLCRQHR